MLTPVDLETMVFRRGLRGYRTREVQEFMKRITADYEKLYKENFDLKEKLEALEEQLNAYRQMEKTLNDTLYLAQETANEMKAAGEKKAEVILREAEQRAEQMKMRVREEIQTELQNLAELKQQVEFFRIQLKRFLQTLIEIADRRLDLDEIWDKMMELSRHDPVPVAAGREGAAGQETIGGTAFVSQTADSFSRRTKEELARRFPDAECCARAELAAIIHTAGSLHFQASHRLVLSVESENIFLLRKVFRLLKAFFQVRTEAYIKETERLGGRRRYSLYLRGEDR